MHSKAQRQNGSDVHGASTACHRYEEGKVTEVKAELVGNLWKIVVEVGQAVDEDDTLMILESMKMEIPITSPTAGTITQILVAEGEVVQEGQTVAIVD
jgi:acetyl-CoA carboxylase biotin carboxyl carrier protein